MAMGSGREGGEGLSNLFPFKVLNFKDGSVLFILLQFYCSVVQNNKKEIRLTNEKAIRSRHIQSNKKNSS